jgi:hypothetical protein
MTRTVRLRALGVGLALISAATAVVNGQSAAARTKTSRPAASARTVDGQPDLQGFWTNDTVTPLERPAEFGNKDILSPEEAAAYAKKRLDQFLAQPKDNIHYDDAIWQAESYSKEANRRTSLVTEPRDGKLPPLTPAAQKREAAKAAARKGVDPSDSAQTRSLAERCITWGNVGPPMIPPTYNANLQIMQTRDTVIILHEMMHDARIIPLDGSAHPPSKIQFLAGDSRGHWDGETLVIDTTNFTDKTNFRGPPLTTRQDIAASETLHVIERFTRVDADTIRYQFTVEDPNTWTAPWSGEIAIRKWDGPIYEYACHEGNYGLANILRAARVEDAKKARTARPASN